MADIKFASKLLSTVTLSVKLFVLPTGQASEEGYERYT